ncbi:MAG: hypothetical protein PHE24_00970 [Patescibacteria group bacterium]|nr:hypothetical protein [Patescibacteria group bacterium]
MAKKFTSKKSFSVILISVFAAAFLVQAIAAAALFFMPATAQAAPYPPLKLQVPIPTLSGGQINLTTEINFSGSTKPIADYIKLIYNYAVGVVGIVAAVVLMIGGLMWITAGGNASNVTEAKAMITASLTGFVLVLASYLLLDQINPALVNLSSNLIGIQTTTTAPPTAQKICHWSHAPCGTGETDLILPFPNGKISQGTKDCGPNYIKDNGDGTYIDNSSHCCCVPVVAAQAAGQCQPVTSGACAVDKMTGFGDDTIARQASAICNGESANGTLLKSTTDICLGDNNPVSIGLFQINLTVHELNGLNCPSAFSNKYTGDAASHNCHVTNPSLYNDCVNAALDPDINLPAAYGIYSASGWGQWGYYLKNCKSAF